MVDEVLSIMEPGRGGVYLDATVGLGGHCLAVLGALPTGGRVIGMDRDQAALDMAGARIVDARLALRKGRFSDIPSVLATLGVGGIDGALFDFGVSMMQLKDADRGFSFLSEAPLDMRMDRSQGRTAEDIVMEYDEEDLARVIYEYGEEHRSRRIARAIVRERGDRPIRTCRGLAEIVARAAGRGGRTHPATRTFQALRIEVNDELREVAEGLRAACAALLPGGRLVAISYHSLEDRIVKHFARDEGKLGTVRILTKKPLRPGRDETRGNPAARSARLRAMERTA